MGFSLCVWLGIKSFDKSDFPEVLSIKSVIFDFRQTTICGIFHNLKNQHCRLKGSLNTLARNSQYRVED